MYLATSNVDIGSDPFMYWQTNLADNVWSYDIDVSNVGCKESCTFIYGRAFLATMSGRSYLNHFMLSGFLRALKLPLRV